MNQRCADCGMGLVSDRQWRHLSRDERKAKQAAGLTRHDGHGLCARCTSARRRASDELRAEPVDSEVVAEEWGWLANPWRSDQDNAEALAPRLGMSPGSLLKAVQRLRARGVLEEARELVA